MRRIGLVTYHMPFNHGARLQAFALQTAIENTGCACEIINYKIAPKPSRGLLPSVAAARCFSTLVNIWFGQRIRKCEAAFEQWATNHYHLTPAPGSEQELSELAQNFDGFVCGSDQLWRNPSRGFYYLAFAPEGKRKIAYAPSFGRIQYTSDEERVIKAHADSFHSLSARETDGAEFLARLTGHEVPSVLDPTLLHSTDFWRKQAVPSGRKLPDRFILVFTVQNTMPCYRVAVELGRRRGLPLVAVDTARRLVWNPSLTNAFDSGPGEFLNLLDRAEFVVTTSFHGTAFAVNYGKPFLTVCQGSARNVNSRMTSLAEKLGFQERLIFPGNSVPDLVLHPGKEEGSLAKTATALKTERIASLKYLAGSLTF